MTHTNSLLNLIERGRRGDNQGLSLGLPKLEQIIDGLTQETYYLVAAGTGNGKTSLVLHSFIYKALLDTSQDRDLQFIIFSLEMSAEQLLAKLLSIHIYETYGKQISFKELLSRGKGVTLSDEDYDLVQECIPWLESIEDRLIIHDGTLNSEKYKEMVIADLKKFGTFVDEDTYVLNNPNQIIAIITDHLGLVRPLPGRSKKEEIDTISAYGVSFRNKCKVSPINIMQFNRNSNNSERLKQGLQEPDLSDLKESGSPSEDANVVLVLYNPFRNKLSSYRGYDIKELKDGFRSLLVLKNRFGSSDIAIGTGFYGRCGIFKELPIPSEINDYERYKHPDWTIIDFPEDEAKAKRDDLCVTITL